MPLRKTGKLLPPRDWEEFESLCADLFRRLWNDPGTQKVGRTGQAQQGVDVIGRPNQGPDYAGVQARNKVYPPEGLTIRELHEAVEKAKMFFPRLAEFTVATTAPNDAKIQEEARRLTQEHLSEGLFSVTVLSWEELETRIAEHEDIFSAYYPQFLARSDGQPSEAAHRTVELLERQAKWAEEKERPRFDLAQIGGSRLAATFTPEFNMRHAGGDPIAHLEWRFRGPLFSMEWRGISTAALDRTRILNTFDLTSVPVEDDLVQPNQMGIEIRFHWHGKMRGELHRWPISRTLHPAKVMYDIGDEVIPPLCFDDMARPHSQ